MILELLNGFDLPEWKKGLLKLANSQLEEALVEKIAACLSCQKGKAYTIVDTNKIDLFSLYIEEFKSTIQARSTEVNYETVESEVINNLATQIKIELDKNLT
jgi:hypothetical protein